MAIHPDEMQPAARFWPLPPAGQGVADRERGIAASDGDGTARATDSASRTAQVGLRG